MVIELCSPRDESTGLRTGVFVNMCAYGGRRSVQESVCSRPTDLYGRFARTFRKRSLWIFRMQERRRVDLLGIALFRTLLSDHVCRYGPRHVSALTRIQTRFVRRCSCTARYRWLGERGSWVRFWTGATPHQQHPNQSNQASSVSLGISGLATVMIGASGLRRCARSGSNSVD